jgi:anti-anti-sigma regulatory factor
MDFKIDTKSNYIHITPGETFLDAKLATAIAEKCQNLAEDAAANFIVDLQSCKDGEAAAFHTILSLHEECYSTGHSLVFIQPAETLLQKMKQEQLHLAINISPTLIEAVDIISMEILERDLFNEES